MADDDEDEWPEPERDPAKLARARSEIANTVRRGNRRMLRYVYAGLALLVIAVILLATLR